MQEMYHLIQVYINKYRKCSSEDTTIPIVVYYNPTDNATVTAGNVLISGTAGDNAGGSGVRRVEVRVDDTGTYANATPQAQAIGLHGQLRVTSQQ